MDEGKIIIDPVFKGCTRPATLGGVPVVPLVLVCGVACILAVVIHFAIAALVPFLYLTMRQIASQDDQQFRLLGLKLYFRIINFNRNRRFWRASCFSPFTFKR